MSPHFNVMFLDDDDYLLNAYRRMLRSSPFDCVFEHSCHSAQHYLSTQPVSLLVVDYLMPEQNGLDFCAQKKSWLQMPRCYLLSGMHDPMKFEQAMQQKIIHGVLSKPVTKAELLAFLLQQQSELADVSLQE